MGTSIVQSLLSIASIKYGYCKGTNRYLFIYLFYNILFIYFFIVFYIPSTCANTLEQSAYSRVWYLSPFSEFQLRLSRPFVTERLVCTPSTKPQLSTTRHNTNTVYCNRTAHSRHCLPASVVARELNLKCVWATGESNPRLFAPADECVTTRPPRPLDSIASYILQFGNSSILEIQMVSDLIVEQANRQ